MVTSICLVSCGMKDENLALAFRLFKHTQNPIISYCALYTTFRGAGIVHTCTK